MNRFETFYNALCKMGLVKTQQDFAKATSISRPVISLLLSGKRNLTEKHIRSISQAYSFINEEWLRKGEGEMYNYYPSESVNADANIDWEAFVKDWLDLHTTSDGSVDLTPYDDSRIIDYLANKSSLYDMKSEEVKELYSRLSEKEDEIAKLHRTIQRQALTIQQLQKQLAGLNSGKKTPNQTSGDNPTLD